MPHRVSWRAVTAMVRHAGRESAIYRVAEPVQAAWATNDYLSAMAVDLLRMLVWMQSKDGQKGHHRPEPITRPGRKPLSERFGDRKMTTTQIDDYLARKGLPPLRKRG